MPESSGCEADGKRGGGPPIHVLWWNAVVLIQPTLCALLIIPHDCLIRDCELVQSDPKPYIFAIDDHVLNNGRILVHVIAQFVRSLRNLMCGMWHIRYRI